MDIRSGVAVGEVLDVVCVEDVEVEVCDLSVCHARDTLDEGILVHHRYDACQVLQRSYEYHAKF